MHRRLAPVLGAFILDVGEVLIEHDADFARERDKALAAAVQRKDRKATAEFVQQHADALYAYVLARVRPNVDDAEDLTQEVFLAACRSVGEYRAVSSLKAWLFGIAPTNSRGVKLGAIRFWRGVAANGSFRCCCQSLGRGDLTRSYGEHLSERFWIECRSHDQRVHCQLERTQAIPLVR